jgi:prephenate dehydrogenase
VERVTSLPVIQPAPGRDGDAPIFAKVAVVGLGLIGGSLARAVRQRWPRSLVIGVDRNDVLERAMAHHAVDVGADDLGMVSDADLIVLAAPVEDNVTCLAALGDVVARETIVTDVGSTKRTIVEAAGRLPARLAFVGGHPLAGAARSGIDHGSPEMFVGRPWILTPAGDHQGATVERLVGFVSGLGARPRVMTAAEHDAALARLSHLPQLAASALMRVVGDAVGDDGLALAGRGLVDTTRLASSPASVWTDICRTNADEIGEALDAYIAVLTDVRRSLATPDVVAALFDTAARWRDSLTREAQRSDT